MADYVAGVTDSNAVCVQAAVPGVNVHEYRATYDGRLNHCISGAEQTSVDWTLRWKLQRQFHQLSYTQNTVPD